MKKYFLFLTAFLLSAALFSGCACQHEWKDATCTTSKSCVKCSASEGEELGHIWKDADCTNPKTCTRCGLTEGTATGHRWTEATCTTTKTCSLCTATEGQPLEHTWSGEATLYEAPVCTVCETVGEPLPGYLAQNNLLSRIQTEPEADYTTCTKIRPDLDTTGKVFVSEMETFDYDNRHRTKKGFEWHRVNISVRFSDNRSMLYGANVSFAIADYYQPKELKKAEKNEQFTIRYKDQDYKCTASFEDSGIYYTEDGMIFLVTCCIQVPIGYDGVVLAFYNGNTEIDGMQLHQLEDENMLLFRMS